MRSGSLPGAVSDERHAPRRRPSLRLALAATLTVTALLGACGGDEKDASPPWVDYNRQRQGWTAEGRRAVAGVAGVLAAQAGCSALAGENFRAWARTYRAGDLPLPLAAGSCDLGDGEVVLLEAFGSEPPTVRQALAARTEAVCPLVRREGLPGQPYVITRDGVLIQPDTPRTAARLGELFPGAEVGAVCPEATRRFFDRLGTTTTTPPTSPAPGAGG
jgi:hypothetical protein